MGRDHDPLGFEMKSPRAKKAPAIRKPQEYGSGLGAAWIEHTRLVCIDVVGSASAKDARRLIAWLTRAVEYLESKEKKERKGK